MDEEEERLIIRARMEAGIADELNKWQVWVDEYLTQPREGVEVPLVIYDKDGNRTEVGSATLHKDGWVNGEISSDRFSAFFKSGHLEGLFVKSTEPDLSFVPDLPEMGPSLLDMEKWKFCRCPRLINQVSISKDLVDDECPIHGGK